MNQLVCMMTSDPVHPSGQGPSDSESRKNKRPTTRTAEVGLTPTEATNTLPSLMNRLRTSWLRPRSLTADATGSHPMRAVPSRCQSATRQSCLVERFGSLDQVA